MKFFLLIIFWFLFIQDEINGQLSLNVLSEDESVANWIYCKEEWDCMDQPCHCPFPAILDSTSDDALNIPAQIQKQKCVNPLEDCSCYFGLCVCAWECGKSRTELKGSSNLED